MRSTTKFKKRGSKAASFLMRGQKVISSKKKKKRTEIHGSFAKGNEITLYHGDCLELLKTIPDASVDLVVTSPPYCIGKEYEDTTSVEDFQQFHARLMPEIIRVTKEGGSIGSTAP